MRICLFEDEHVSSLEPLITARAVYDLLSGAATIREKVEHVFQSPATGTFVRPTIAKLVAQVHPSFIVNESEWLQCESTLLVSGRWLPPRDFEMVALPTTPFVATSGNEVVYAYLTPELLSDCTPATIHQCLAAWRRELPNIPATGKLIRHPWELVQHNRDEIANDFTRLPATYGAPSSNLLVTGSPTNVLIHSQARIEPFVVIDASQGPVIIAEKAHVGPFTRLEGPCFIGPRSHLFAANIRAGTSIGRDCRVGGEVSQSILLAHSNKAHEGYLGHSYVGEWVNLGAGTHVSDLRNDHASISVATPNGELTTNVMRVGSFIGDHVKSGVGCRLNAGSHIGAFARLLPCGSLLPKYVPSFCSVEYGRLIAADELHDLFDSAERVTARRGKTFSTLERATFKAHFERHTQQRQIAVHEAELRRLRRAG